MAPPGVKILYYHGHHRDSSLAGAGGLYTSVLVLVLLNTATNDIIKDSYDKMPVIH